MEAGGATRITSDEDGGAVTKRMLLVAPNLSRRMGGEALKALQIFVELRAMGIDAVQLTHARVREELARDEPTLPVHYVEDGPLQIALHKLGGANLLSWLNSWQLHRRARSLANELAVDLVHFTAPISPVVPYFSIAPHPVVIGPLNGNIHYPPAFRDRQPRRASLEAALLPWTQKLLGLFARGKRKAILLVAGGERTRQALRLGGCSDLQMVASVDCGLPAGLFKRPLLPQRGRNHAFVFIGRLIPLKGVDLAIEAIARAGRPFTLDVIGDGPERAKLETLTANLGIADQVNFKGWVPPGDRLFELLGRYRGLVFPSLREANGIVFQEAMAIGLPIVTLKWGGATELLDQSSALLIEPAGVEEVVEGLAGAVRRLAVDEELAGRLARAARGRAESYAWPTVLSDWLNVYAMAVAGKPLPLRERQLLEARRAGHKEA